MQRIFSNLNGRLSRAGNFASLFSVIGVLLATAVFARAQYKIESWTTDDGLPQNTVSSILQTPDGYLWLATLDGLVRFDGVKFSVFNKNNSKGIVSNRFTQLITDARGVLWVGTEESGVIRYQDGAFETFEIGASKSEPIRNLILNEAGEVFVISRDGFFKWNGEKFAADKPFADADKNGIILRGAASGVVWSINGQTLYRVKDDRRTEFQLPGEEIEVNRLVEDNRGRLWIGTLEGSLLILENEKITVLTTENGLPKSRITPRIEDSNGNLWAATDAGAVVFAPDGKITRISAEQGLSDNTLTAIYEDREGSIWIGTLYRGLNRLSRQSVAFFGVEDGLAANIVHPIFQARNGDVWLGGAGLTRYHDGVFNGIADNKENYFGVITAIEEDRHGRLWFGHWNGAFYIERNEIKNFTEEFKSTPAVMDIHEDRAGNVWFATNQGLFKWQNDSMTRLTSAEGLPSDDVKVILESKSGAIWVGAYGGLSEIKQNSIKTFTTAEGLSSNLVRSLYEDTDATLWIGSYDGGLTRLKNAQFTRYTSSEGLFNDGVFQILPDDDGNLWMSSNRGVYRVAKRQLNDFADGKIKRIESIAYSKADGLEETECNGGQQPAGTRTADGKLWFPTQRGVAVINPKEIKVNPYPPPIVLEAAIVDGETIAPRERIEIAPGKNNLEIAYTGLSFIKPEFVKFRYKLDGLDKDWVEAGDRRTAYYSYLPPGEYTFQVIAANSDGVWNTTGASVKVTVVPPFYRTWWFWALSACLIAGAVYFFYRRRVANLKKKEQAQRVFSQQLIESQERERQRIAGELHDGLSQNLVIIKNRAMMTLGERENSEYVFEQIEEIVEAAGESLAEVRVIANNLRPFQIDRLGLTKAIEALVRKANTANLRVMSHLDNIDGVFSSQMEINLYRIVQESLNNIIKHSEATEATITIKKNAGQIEIVIKDNGKGFDASARFYNESANGSGFGITGIYERARMFGAIPSIESNAGNGTIIRLKIGGSFD